MKFLVTMTVKDGTSRERLEPLLGDEARAAWTLYTEEVFRELYFTDAPGVVVAVVEAEDADDVRRRVGELPLAQAGLMDVAVRRLQPFLGWAALFGSA